MQFFKIILILGACIIAACSKRPSSYESRFQDEIHIGFPSGHPENEIDAMRKHIDEKLRRDNTGFFSGVLVLGRDIDFISIDTDFASVDEHSLIAGLIQDGMIPKDAEVTYNQRTNSQDIEDPKKP